LLQSIKIDGQEFKRVDYTAVDGKKSVVMSGPEINSLKIEASCKGLDIGGCMITTHRGLEAFAKMISAMWSEAERLKPKIATSTKDIPDPCV
jgi:hypothetical protein